MDSTKKEKINQFLRMWDYKLNDLVSYLHSVAPEMKSNAQRAKENGMNDFLAGLVGQNKAQRQGHEIPKPNDQNQRSGIAFDAWILLGNGDDALCLEDISDYIEERVRNTEAKQREIAESHSMGMSSILHGMNREIQERESAEAIDTLFGRHDRLWGDKRSMNEVLAALPAKDAQRLTIVSLPDVS